MEQQLHSFGYIVDGTDRNIFILNIADAIMYNELFNFKKWPSISFDLISNKLADNNVYTFREIYKWMNQFNIDGGDIQFIVVRADSGIYIIYCNYFESINFFRSYILKEDVIIISINLKVSSNVLSYDSDYRPGYHQDIYSLEYQKDSTYRLYDEYITFFDNCKKEDKYSFSYAPTVNADKKQSLIHSQVYIMDKLDDKLMDKIDNWIFNIKNNKIHTSSSFLFLNYGKLPYKFDKYPHSFWDGGL